MISSGPIALDALGAGIPGRNAAVDIEQKNRIVDHALDQNPKQLVAAGHQGQGGGFFDGARWELFRSLTGDTVRGSNKKSGNFVPTTEPQFSTQVQPPG